MFRRTVCMMGIRIASAVAAGLLILAYTFAVGSAQDTGGPAVVDPISCGHFETQENAQQALHSGELSNPENLDPDGDGIACETRWPVDPDSPPAVYEPTSCGHFETQEDAQEAFDSGDLPAPENLDADGDGIVCEIRWGEAETDTGAEVVALPDTGTGAVTGTGPGPMLIAMIAGFSAAGGAILRLRRIA